MKYRLLLVLAALIWGSAFVAQVVGMDTIGPFTFGGVRFLLGSASLLPIIYMNRHKENPKSTKIPLWAAFLMTGLPLLPLPRSSRSACSSQRHQRPVS